MMPRCNFVAPESCQMAGFCVGMRHPLDPRSAASERKTGVLAWHGSPGLADLRNRSGRALLRVPARKKMDRRKPVKSGRRLIPFNTDVERITLDIRSSSGTLSRNRLRTALHCRKMEGRWHNITDDRAKAYWLDSYYL